MTDNIQRRLTRPETPKAFIATSGRYSFIPIAPETVGDQVFIPRDTKKMPAFQVKVGK